MHQYVLFLCNSPYLLKAFCSWPSTWNWIVYATSYLWMKAHVFLFEITCSSSKGTSGYRRHQKHCIFSYKLYMFKHVYHVVLDRHRLINTSLHSVLSFHYKSLVKCLLLIENTTDIRAYSCAHALFRIFISTSTSYPSIPYSSLQVSIPWTVQ